MSCLDLDSQNISLAIKAFKGFRLGYIFPWMHSFMVSLDTKARYYSMEFHFQGPMTYTYGSKPPNGTYIKNHRMMTPSRGHVLLVEETFLSLDG